MREGDKGPKEKYRETAMTEKRKGGENGECQAGSPHFDDFASTMLINQQMRLGKGRTAVSPLPIWLIYF